VQAGLTSNHAVAWVAANVDAISQKKPTDKPVPYRVLFLYEKAGAGWKLVQAHFSFVTGG
jgi:ketosteroid isomerase-like protein